MLQTHGMPRVMGILSHLDLFKKAKQIRKVFFFFDPLSLSLFFSFFVFLFLSLYSASLSLSFSLFLSPIYFFYLIFLSENVFLNYFFYFKIDKKRNEASFLDGDLCWCEIVLSFWFDLWSLSKGFLFFDILIFYYLIFKKKLF